MDKSYLFSDSRVNSQTDNVFRHPFCMDSPIKILRKQKGFATQGALAKRIGVSQSVVSNWENGITLPRGANLMELSRALDAHPTQIIGRGSKVPDIQRPSFQEEDKLMDKFAQMNPYERGLLIAQADTILNARRQSPAENDAERPLPKTKH